jgi:hypothetical protein
MAKKEKRPFDREWHGLTGTKIYKIWRAMRRRCYDETNRDYHTYGGKGVKVCQDWDTRFIPFYEWAKASGYEDGLEIDRIDNNGDYEPANCRWVTHKENCRNQERTVFIDFHGDRIPLADACEITGVLRKTVDGVMLRSGYTCTHQQAFDYLFLRVLFGDDGHSRNFKFEAEQWQS